MRAIILPVTCPLPKMFFKASLGKSTWVIELKKTKDAITIKAGTAVTLQGKKIEAREGSLGC